MQTTTKILSITGTQDWKNIVQFYSKTINKTTQEITRTELSFKTNTNNNPFQKIKREIMKNKELSKKISRQQKFKLFNRLKNNPLVPSHTNSREEDATHDRLRKLLYWDIIKCKPGKSSIDKNSNELQIPAKPRDK